MRRYLPKVRVGRAALGFRVRSGWAVSILIDGSVRSPPLCESDAINLSDPRNPEMRQPYHAAMGILEMNAAKLTRRVQSVRQITEKSIVNLLKRCTDNGYAIRRAALVVGSVINPDSIANPHIRAHALEGRLFRTTLETALQSRRIQSRFSSSVIHTQQGRNSSANHALKYSERLPISAVP